MKFLRQIGRVQQNEVRKILAIFRGAGITERLGTIIPLGYYGRKYE
jgi:hypothetical protein